MTTKHTPGPWHVGTKDATTVWSEKTLIAAYVSQLNDARLIAAAPDLLGTLEQILALHEADPDDLETMDAGIKIARAAIKQATEGS